jgi:hypothetical protein
LNGVGGCLGGVDDDGAHGCAIEEGLDAEVEIGLWAGDGGAEVGVGIADLDDGGLSRLIWMMGAWIFFSSIGSELQDRVD